MKKVVIITTGGTIAMRAAPSGKGVVPAVSGADLVQAVPGLAELCDIQVREFSNIPSCQMTPEKMHALASLVKDIAADTDVSGIVITHGTDTVEESSFYLDTVLDLKKPVVFTAAMRDAGGISPDGPKNILNAVKTALEPQAADLGVVVVLNDQIYAARDVAKTHSANVAAFAAPGWGPLGYVDDDRVVIARYPAPRPHFFPEAPGGEVHLLKMTAGMSADILHWLIEKNAAGIVVEGFGRGNVPPAVQDAMLRAVAKGIPVVLASRTGAGRPAHAYGYAGGGRISWDGGVIFAGDLPGVKARLLLALALGMTRDMGELRKYFEELPGACV